MSPAMREWARLTLLIFLTDALAAVFASGLVRTVFALLPDEEPPAVQPPPADDDEDQADEEPPAVAVVVMPADLWGARP